MTYNTLLTELDSHVLTLTLNRPQAGNALNTEMLTELNVLLGALYIDPGDVRCIILTGAGEKIFCGGGDLKERKGMTDEAWRRQHALAEQIVRHLIECPVPIIAAVNGAAFGGGCELVSAVDFAYGVDTARFALTETSLGIIPGAGGTQTLPRAVGVRRAKEIILTAAAFTAQEAYDWGLLNRVCTQATLMAETRATALRIAGNAPVAIRQAKKSINMATQSDLASGYRFELEAYYRTVPTTDRIEGVLAYNEKRKPVFHGR